tara:strand:- start:20682 stop:21680 length:999 start_codon:yes stop_codon:yes gene_type:complete
MSYLEIIDIKFFIIFSIIFISNIIILKYRYQIAKNLKIIDIPNKRKIHNKPTPLIGGINYFLSLVFLLVYILFNNEINLQKFISLISIYSLFFFVGFFDDVRALSAKLRSIVIISSLILLILFDPEFMINNLNFKTLNLNYNLNYISSLFTLFCIFALYNALNFIDGYNGSAISIIIFWSIFIFIKNPNIVYLIIILISFLIFSYNLSGKIFLGNSGTSIISIFFSLSVINEHNNGMIYADEILLIFLFPGIDMIRVTAQRLIKKKNIYDPDKTHFHHYLIYSKSRYVWQIIFVLSIIPIVFFTFIENFIIVLFISIIIYISLFKYLKKYNE